MEPGDAVRANLGAAAVVYVSDCLTPAPAPTWLKKLRTDAVELIRATEASVTDDPKDPDDSPDERRIADYNRTPSWSSEQVIEGVVKQVLHVDLAVPNLKVATVFFDDLAKPSGTGEKALRVLQFAACTRVTEHMADQADRGGEPDQGAAKALLLVSWAEATWRHLGLRRMHAIKNLAPLVARNRGFEAQAWAAEVADMDDNAGEVTYYLLQLAYHLHPQPNNKLPGYLSSPRVSALYGKSPAWAKERLSRKTHRTIEKNVPRTSEDREEPPT